MEGKSMLDNPYTPDVCPYSNHFVAWFAGWCEAERDKPKLNKRSWLLSFLRQ